MIFQQSFMLMDHNIGTKREKFIEIMIFQQSFYKEGEVHRDNDLPAIIEANGTQYWFKKGKPHRDNNLPAIIRADGTREWWKEGKRIFQMHRNLNDSLNGCGSFFRIQISEFRKSA
eukprot:TRINITY_DN4452_c0_g1_i17.p1 TRINITY_DN4452_c0_g1~~TRINITY_DN4452_c0_g1_i17.p1  ORF type:complete len:116 (+),score=25.07 TRINITY_DN4452_c0_g1_i17:74-421(+)